MPTPAKASAMRTASRKIGIGRGGSHGSKVGSISSTRDDVESVLFMAFLPCISLGRPRDGAMIISAVPFLQFLVAGRVAAIQPERVVDQFQGFVACHDDLSDGWLKLGGRPRDDVVWRGFI